MKELNEFFGLMSFAVTVILVVFIIARYTYLIKKAMIDRGLNLEQNNTKYRYLDIGCIIFGLGVGLLVSSIFTMMNLSEDTTDLLVWGTILIFGATGSILSHFIRKKLE